MGKQAIFNKEIKNSYRILAAETQRKRPHMQPGHRCEDNIKM